MAAAGAASPGVGAGQAAAAPPATYFKTKMTIGFVAVCLVAFAALILVANHHSLNFVDPKYACGIPDWGTLPMGFVGGIALGILAGMCFANRGAKNLAQVAPTPSAGAAAGGAQASPAAGAGEEEGVEGGEEEEGADANFPGLGASPPPSAPPPASPLPPVLGSASPAPALAGSPPPPARGSASPAPAPAADPAPVERDSVLGPAPARADVAGASGAENPRGNASGPQGRRPHDDD